MISGKSPRKLELLAPAASASIAVEAVKHGADAVYIGPPSHGARKAAANSIEDIEKVVDFAHRYRAKVYATVNTIIYENEIKSVESLIRDLYTVGVDALIVQDLGILRMKIPPIALHASTQCDIRTPQKAKFLEEVGFSQLVLARELSLEEIKAITSTVKIPVETFVHGALCVSYSGRCHASFAINGRSANRGECAQICRFPYTLTDSLGKVISKDKYLLSLKDFNASKNLESLIEAGVSSFKIEGRLKDAGYVKNITALYNRQINQIIKNHPDKFARSSYGDVSLKFIPKADKSFNRGFTNYFLTERRPLKIASLLTPKSQGEKINNVSDLNNGDGISFFNREGEFTGVNVNRVENGKIITARKVRLPKTGEIFRTSDVKWDKLIAGETAERKIWLDLSINETFVKAYDERGVEVILPFDLKSEPARQTIDYRPLFEKLGGTIYSLRNFEWNLKASQFYRASELSSLRRKILKLLEKANHATYPFSYRNPENKKAIYPFDSLDYRDNVSNSLAREFYSSHGVQKIENAAEIRGIKEGDVVMTTRHCILRELGMCKKETQNWEKFSFPLYLNYSSGRFRLHFDCKSCEMQVLK